MDRRTGRRKNSRKNRRRPGWMDESTEDRTDGRIDGRIEVLMKKRTNRCSVTYIFFFFHLLSDSNLCLLLSYSALLLLLSPVFTAIGCTDPWVPKGAWMKRAGEKAIISCNYTSQTWHIVCQGSGWYGNVDNCTTCKNRNQSQYESMQSIIGAQYNVLCSTFSEESLRGV